MLQVKDLVVAYGQSQALHGISFEARENEAVAIMGRNGMGKTTLLKTILGLVRPKEGRVAVNGRDTTHVAPHRIAHDLSLSRQGHTVIERHHDIGAQRFFNFNRGLRRNEMCRPIEMRLKAHSLIRHFAQFGKTENLKSTAVRQDRSGPPGKPMQSTQLSDNLVSRTQIQMIGIVQHKTKAELL